jgi:sporulation protein YlmC with PRC-barrel domain
MTQRDHTSPKVLSASTICGDAVVNADGEDLGQIEELMVDLDNGRIAYAVLSFSGFLGIGDKLFAIPFDALRLDAENQRFVLDLPRERLEQAPGFEKGRWPDFADERFGQQVYGYYDVQTYW